MYEDFSFLLHLAVDYTLFLSFKMLENLIQGCREAQAAGKIGQLVLGK